MNIYSECLPVVQERGLFIFIKDIGFSMILHGNKQCRHNKKVTLAITKIPD
jgi:hypothetical protein